MRTVRIGVFETNSSSSHTLHVCTEKGFTAWKDGLALLSPNGNIEFLDTLHQTLVQGRELDYELRKLNSFNLVDTEELDDILELSSEYFSYSYVCLNCDLATRLIETTPENLVAISIYMYDS